MSIRVRPTKVCRYTGWQTIIQHLFFIHLLNNLPGRRNADAGTLASPSTLCAIRLLHQTRQYTYAFNKTKMKTPRKLFCFLLLILSASSILAQKDIPVWKNQLKLSPFRTIDLVNPGIEVSYERRQNARFSTQLSLGLMKDIFNLMHFTNYAGTRISLEEKFFPRGGSSNQYYSIEAAYLNVRYKTNSYFIQDTALRTPQYNDSFQVAKQTFAVNFKYGVEIPLKRFVIDISAGLGLKCKAIERKDILDPKAYEVTSRDLNAYDLANKEGNYVTVNVPFNVRFGYIF